MPHPLLRVCLTATGEEKGRAAWFGGREHAERELARPETDDQSGKRAWLSWAIPVILKSITNTCHRWEESQLPKRRVYKIYL